jgi:hypothetical protein
LTSRESTALLFAGLCFSAGGQVPAQPFFSLFSAAALKKKQPPLASRHAAPPQHHHLNTVIITIMFVSR